jgi:hypothetical protein
VIYIDEGHDLHFRSKGADADEPEEEQQQM